MKALTSEQCRNKFFPNKEVLMKKKVVSVLMAAAMVAGMADAVPAILVTQNNKFKCFYK